MSDLLKLAARYTADSNEVRGEEEEEQEDEFRYGGSSSRSLGEKAMVGTGKGLLATIPLTGLAGYAQRTASKPLRDTYMDDQGISDKKKYEDFEDSIGKKRGRDYKTTEGGPPANINPIKDEEKRERFAGKLNVDKEDLGKDVPTLSGERTDNSAVLAHEMGHLSDKGDIVPYKLGAFSAGPGGWLAGGAVGGGMALSDNKKIRKWAPVGALAPQIPGLYEEGRANVIGDQILRDQGVSGDDLWKGRKELAKSYGGYLAPALATAAGAYGLGKYKDWKEKKDEQRNKRRGIELAEQIEGEQEDEEDLEKESSLQYIGENLKGLL